MRRKTVVIFGAIGLLVVALVFVWLGGGNESNKPTTDEDNETITVQIPTASEALEKVAGNSNVSGARYFANNTWLVGVTGADNSGEVYTIVAKLSGGRWTTVDVGSFIDTELLLLDGAPPDLISYMEGI